MRTKLTALLSLTLVTVLLVGAGCMESTTTTTNTTVNNTNTVKDTTTEDGTEDTTEEDSTIEDEANETESVDGDETSEEANEELSEEDTDTTMAIAIVSPEDGATVGTSFDLIVDVEGFELAPELVEDANVDGMGHYHVWIDGEYFAPGVSEETALEQVAVGEHTLQVSLQNNDHSDLETKVMSEPVTITVE